MFIPFIFSPAVIYVSGTEVNACYIYLSLFLTPVTEDEIRRGIISASSPTETHCCWFKRVIVDLHEHVESPNASKFVDKTWGPNAGIDEAAQALLGSLRETELPQALPSNMVFHYDVKWTENGIDPESSVEHAQYIDNLCACFYDTLTGMIENGISISVESRVRDHLVDEVFQHAAFCQKKCETFHGREEFMKDVREALLRNNKKRLVVLHGESGCGKTSLMAKLATQVKTWVDGGTANVVLRFVGTSPDASHVRSLLRSVCMQLYRAVDEDIKDVPEVSFSREWSLARLHTIDGQRSKHMHASIIRTDIDTNTAIITITITNTNTRTNTSTDNDNDIEIYTYIQI